ncbi:DNA-directed DNA polymerase epsilon, subunit B [Pyricularia oryzae]
MGEAQSPPRLSPRKKRAQKPLGNGFFGGIKETPGRAAPPLSSAAPSSSPAFATPAHTLRPFNPQKPAGAAILPILLPPATLRPLAFRTFTKKHSLTLTSSALQELASFVGRHCGSGWREEGLAERVLEEVAKSWKAGNGGVIVDGASPILKDILKTLEGNMVGGKIVTGAGKGLVRQNSLLLDPSREPDYSSTTRLGLRPSIALQRDDSQSSMGMSGLNFEEEPEEDTLSDPRKWLKVVGAYEQPRMVYNVAKKHFERDASKPSILPTASHKTLLFRNRFNVIHQRLLRNEAFQTSAVADTKRGSLARSTSSLSSQQSYKITPIANLLGRHGSHHMLLGMLVIMPAGNLAVSDLTGTIALDVTQAATIPDDSSWFTPGMVVLIDGVYEEEDDHTAKGLSGSSGIGGTIGGRFQGFFIGQPPCEKRRATLGVSGPEGDGLEHTIGGGFGWIDFLGVGSERAMGPRMRKLERRLLRQPQLSRQDMAASVLESSLSSTLPRRGRIIILGELNLDQPRALQALRKILATYANETDNDGSENDAADETVASTKPNKTTTPLAFVLAGSFSSQAVMARNGAGGGGGGGSAGLTGSGGGGSIEYKEYFDSLAGTLAEFPSLLRESTFVFVPGDNDGWASSFGAGAAVPLPRKAVPDLFTSRVRRAFATANAEGTSSRANAPGGEAVFTTNPSRMTLFGPNHEIVLFRDDISARLRRAAVRLKGSSSTSTGPEHDNNEVRMSDDAPTAGDMEIDELPDPAVESAASKEPRPDMVPHDVRAAQKLVKTILDQGYLAPFRTAVRPVHWDHASALHLYPLPTALVLADATAPPFCVTYEGCHVMNPGPLLVPGRRGVARWVEYNVGHRGSVKECLF